MVTYLYQITAPHFTAGIVTNLAGTTVEAAPILAWTRGKTVSEITQYCVRKRWVVTLVEERNDHYHVVE
jgi:hypothetical protein